MTTTRDELAALMGPGIADELRACLKLANSAAIYQLALHECHAEADSDEYREALGRFYAAEHVAHREALAFLRTRGAELVELVGDGERLEAYRRAFNRVDDDSEYRTLTRERFAFIAAELTQELAAIDAMRADGGGNGGG